MKIGVAQVQSHPGKIQKNIEIHKKWIACGISKRMDFIAFPELSLSGYEPKLADELAIDPYDLLLDEFQTISDQGSLIFGVGAPTRSKGGVLISMIIFQPYKERLIYSKQKLHPDEHPYFVAGDKQLIFETKDQKIAPAICYESIQKEHAEMVKDLGGQLYMASVAKSQHGVEEAYVHYSNIAKELKLPVFMSNCIGPCDEFHAAGHSGIWDANGNLMDKLASNTEGILLLDTDSNEVIKIEK